MVQRNRLQDLMAKLTQVTESPSVANDINLTIDRDIKRQLGIGDVTAKGADGQTYQGVIVQSAEAIYPPKPDKIMWLDKNGKAMDFDDEGKKKVGADGKLPSEKLELPRDMSDPSMRSQVRGEPSPRRPFMPEIPEFPSSILPNKPWKEIPDIAITTLKPAERVDDEQAAIEAKRIRDAAAKDGDLASTLQIYEKATEQLEQFKQKMAKEHHTHDGGQLDLSKLDEKELKRYRELEARVETTKDMVKESVANNMDVKDMSDTKYLDAGLAQIGRDKAQQINPTAIVINDDIKTDKLEALLKPSHEKPWITEKGRTEEDYKKFELGSRAKDGGVQTTEFRYGRDDQGQQGPKTTEFRYGRDDLDPAVVQLLSAADGASQGTLKLATRVVEVADSHLGISKAVTRILEDSVAADRFNEFAEAIDKAKGMVATALKMRRASYPGRSVIRVLT